MGKYHFELLAKYNKEANNLMNNVIITLTEEQWDKNFTGYFKSIHEICSHIYFWDYNWFKRPKFKKQVQRKPGKVFCNPNTSLAYY